FGLTDVCWVTNPWGARLAVMIGDVWQWTPFIFIVLLAAIETLPHELTEAAVVDGANRWQVFWRITFPQILPATTTVVLIRIIEGFKNVDLPNVLTNGGPGTATESLTLHAHPPWRARDRAQDAPRCQRRTVLRTVARLPADARFLALHLLRPSRGHVPALPQHRGGRADEHGDHRFARLDGRLRPGAHALPGRAWRNRVFRGRGRDHGRGRDCGRAVAARRGSRDRGVRAAAADCRSTFQARGVQ